MAHGEAHEEAEHAQHAAHNPFDRRVALSMVVIAAVLAAIKLIGHRAHNEVLAYQIRSGTARTESSDLHTQESDTWNLYQAQRLRYHLYNTEVLNRGGRDTDDEAGEGARGESGETPKADPVRDKFEAKRKKAAEKAEREKENAEKKAREAEQKAEEAKRLAEQSEHAHHRTYFFDAAELFVELGVVLCSVAILTKLPGFWYGGMGISGLGVVLAVVGYLM